MNFLHKLINKRVISWLFAGAVFILAINFSIIIIKNNKTQQKNTAEAFEFLNYIEKEELEAALTVWPSVYTHSCSNEEFLDAFSNLLSEKYALYYSKTYLESSDSRDLHEISRIYYSFLNEDSFNSIASSIYDDYIYEKISYADFMFSINDFFFFSGYSSPHITVLLDDAQNIKTYREFYLEAEKSAAIPDYKTAVELLRMIKPRDPVYYPKSIEKINEYITKLRDEVKNGT